jgi:hypothetical protein
MQLVEALYSRFLLADVFGKIVPGFVVLYSAVMTFWSSSSALARVNELGSWGWPAVFGLSWALGLALQRVGQRVRLADEFRDLGAWYELRARFQRVAQETEIQQISRLLVIREASGNGCTALVASLLLPVFSRPCQVLLWFQEDPWTRTVLIVGVIAIAVGLFGLAHEHTRRSDTYVRAVLRVAQQPNPADGAADP